MAIRRNLIVNYASQFYVTVVGIVMIPLYIEHMGPEAYGLVGFFSMLQAIFALLDMGLTPTLARETARFRGGAIGLLEYRLLFRALEGVFAIIALVGGTLLFAGAETIGTSWLNVVDLPVAEVETSLRYIAIIVAMRWVCGLYRGVISGSENLVWLGNFNAVIATLRFVAVLPVLIFIDASPVTFFQYQLAVAVIELAGLGIQAYRLLPPIPPGQKVSWALRPLLSILKFSMAIAFTSSMWVMVTQTDKIVLSRILPLADYGYFTLAVLVASGVLAVSGPIGLVIMPAMARLEAQGDHDGAIRIYRQLTQLTALLAGGAAITVGFMAEPLLSAWTGDPSIAVSAAPILTLYAFGNGVLTLASFPYYLQYAKGDLRLHVAGNAIFIVILLPSIIWMASNYGGIGAGATWLVTNALLLFIWLPFIHARFAPGLNAKWYIQDILAISIPQAIVAYGLSVIIRWPGDRLVQFVQLMVVGLLVLAVGIAASSNARKLIAGRLPWISRKIGQDL